MEITRISSISSDDVWITTDPPAEYYSIYYLSVANNVGPPAHQRNTGIRFTNITIPQGAIIESVTLTVVCYFGGSTNITIRVTGEAADNPNTFASRADYLSRGRTSNYYDWVAPAMITDSEYSIGPGTELKSIIQEIIDRPGWSPGNPLTLFLEWQAGVADCGRNFYSYDDSPGINSPKLTISYKGEDYGVKISKDGYDVKAILTETNKKNFTILSTDSVHKVSTQAVVAADVNIAHGLGFKPFWDAYILTDSLSKAKPTNGYWLASWHISADATHLYCDEIFGSNSLFYIIYLDEP